MKRQRKVINNNRIWLKYGKRTRRMFSFRKAFVLKTNNLSLSRITISEFEEELQEEETPKNIDRMLQII